MSSASQSVLSKPTTTPTQKRAVNRIKKQTETAIIQPTFPTPTPASNPTTQSGSATPVEAENITISHSIRIIKDPVTNSYTYSYIKPNGEEALDANAHNNGFESDSNSTPDDSDDSSSVDSNDSDSEQKRYLLSSAK